MGLYRLGAFGMRGDAAAAKADFMRATMMSFISPSTGMARNSVVSFLRLTSPARMMA